MKHRIILYVTDSFLHEGSLYLVDRCARREKKKFSRSLSRDAIVRAFAAHMDRMGNPDSDLSGEENENGRGQPMSSSIPFVESVRINGVFTAKELLTSTRSRFTSFGKLFGDIGAHTKSAYGNPVNMKTSASYPTGKRTAPYLVAKSMHPFCTMVWRILFHLRFLGETQIPSCRTRRALPQIKEKTFTSEKHYFVTSSLTAIWLTHAPAWTVGQKPSNSTFSVYQDPIHSAILCITNEKCGNKRRKVQKERSSLFHPQKFAELSWNIISIQRTRGQSAVSSKRAVLLQMKLDIHKIS